MSRTLVAELTGPDWLRSALELSRSTQLWSITELKVLVGFAPPPLPLLRAAILHLKPHLARGAVVTLHGIRVESLAVALSASLGLFVIPSPPAPLPAGPLGPLDKDFPFGKMANAMAAPAQISSRMHGLLKEIVGNFPRR